MRLILSMHKSAAKECAPPLEQHQQKNHQHWLSSPTNTTRVKPQVEGRHKKKATLKRLPKRPVPLRVPAERSPPGEIDLRRRLLAEPWGSLLQKEEYEGVAAPPSKTGFLF